MNVQWNGVHDTSNRVGGYIIEYRNSESPSWIENPDVVRHEPGKVQYYGKLTGLSPDTLYFVRIKVVDIQQNVGEPSPEAQGRTGCSAPISPPSNVNLNSPSPRQVRVNWQPPPKSSWLCSAIRYTVEYRNGSQPAKQVSVPRFVIFKIMHFVRENLTNQKFSVVLNTPLTQLQILNGLFVLDQKTMLAHQLGVLN